MNHAFPDATITGYEKLEGEMTCDKGDRHVLAATVHSPAHTLVTFNTKHFPTSSTRHYDIEVKNPDTFLLDLYSLAPGEVTQICYQALTAYTRYPQTPEDYATMLQKSGVPEFAKCIYPPLDALY